MEYLTDKGVESCAAGKKKAVRGRYLAEKIVFVNGQPGCGKSLLYCIISALDRVENFIHPYEIEHTCSFYYLGRLTKDAAIAEIRMLTDLRLYNAMMGREMNFRPSDISSILRSPRPFKYIRRFFQKGDEAVPSRIQKERPIAHLATHNLISFSEPIFSALGDRVVFIEVVRHPLYMLKQQALNMESLNGSARSFTVHIEHNGREIPYYTAGWEDLFIRSNAVEQAIYSIEKLTAKAEESKKLLIEKYNARILTVPFECFVINPWPYLEKIEKALETKVTALTRRTMRKQRVPRKMYADGPGFKIYKRCGWQPPESSSESYEFEIRRRFAQERASKEAMLVLDRICAEYEEKYMKDSRGRRL